MFPTKHRWPSFQWKPDVPSTGEDEGGAWLGAKEIGITLSEEDQLDPEQSTSAVVVHHPQGKYFAL